MPGSPFAFVPDIATMLAFALAAIVLAITPGPDMALQMSRTINYGRAHGFAALGGAMAGLVVHTSLAALGISILIVAAPPLFLALKIAGALYLLWLAVQAIRAGGGLRLAGPSRKMPTVRETFAAAVGVNLLNPKVVLFFVTFLPQFVHAGDPNAPGQLFFLGAEFIVLSIPIGIAMIYAAQWLAKALVANRWIERAVNWGFAAVFASFAALILTAQARH